jgi:hypothetical protein
VTGVDSVGVLVPHPHDANNRVSAAAPETRD